MIKAAWRVWLEPALVCFCALSPRIREASLPREAVLMGAGQPMGRAFPRRTRGISHSLHRQLPPSEIRRTLGWTCYHRGIPTPLQRRRVNDTGRGQEC